MPRYIEAPELSPNEALFVLKSALAENKITRDDIRRYRYELAQEITKLESQLADLRIVYAGGEVPTPFVKSPRLPVKKSEPSEPKKRRKLTITPERAESMKLQGKYIAMLHRIPLKSRAKFQKIAKTEGRDRAISAMEKVLA